MKIIVTNQLSKQQEQEVRQLIAEIRDYDNFTREPYLSNMLNFDQDMPAFFLVYEKNELRGFLTVYADDPNEVDLFIWVAPAYRRQGLARQLFENYKESTRDYGLGKPSFNIERHFLTNNPWLLSAWQVNETNESEFWMSRGCDKVALEERSDIRVCQADLQHLEAIAKFQSETFEEDLELCRQYAREAIEDETSLLYVVLRAEEVIASCTVDLSSGDQLLYGLAVKNAEQGKGIGTYMTKYILNDRIENDSRPFQIAVEADNVVAKRLYEKLGFVIASEITYLR
ncbi:GNAT family N-acetyltransferase [Streptococcus hillyeri]|uniref:GNAT family N-acetyltransferase n=1 Tax=Streptococcus hillyeri TaxID=2282420 RepID=A0A3L9DTX0_9STRE|nr:GNAT family N-acetyltransferase [Streptococcus hillyeri]RLY04771.1 GNAT family N-acetyltransferase [Streptococcus hillyeri]